MRGDRRCAARLGNRSVGRGSGRAAAGRPLRARQRRLDSPRRDPGRQVHHRLVGGHPGPHRGAAARTDRDRGDAARRRRPSAGSRDLYASFMDEAAVERAGPRAARAASSPRSRACGRRASSPARSAGCRRLGVDDADRGEHRPGPAERAALRADLAQGGLGLPDRDYYLVADDAKFAAARASYAAYVARLLQLSGSGADARASSRAP